MSLAPSASATGLLLQCSRPFSKGVTLDTSPPSEAARFGLAWHAVAAWAILLRKLPRLQVLRPTALRHAQAYGAEHIEEELVAHLASTLPILFKWLDALEEREEIESIITEKSFAWDPQTGHVREIPLPTIEDHHYQTRDGEMPGTADLILLTRKPRRRLHVIDHKTGVGDFSRPAQVPQLKTLALFVSRFYRVPLADTFVGVFHAPRFAAPRMFVEPALVESHDTSLAKALARIDDGFMRPGRECETCKARPACPAGDSEMLLKAETLLKQTHHASTALLAAPTSKNLTRDRQLGMLYELITQGETLAERAREAIKREIAEGSVPELSDGRMLVLKKRQVERLSKKEFINAYGKIAAERMFAKWRKDKALTKKPETYLDKSNS